ncbi:MAG: arginine decarboxylase, pyruvoyl-dependent [Firmicutes bacterium]|jgi:arginine decarboxylase|nr:arginine decarboxylase, pyruvoyl-dependent [Bacillota bacterium]
MLPTPTRFTLCVGAGEGASRLNAFDNALLAAKIGNFNLLKVSSILPPGATHVEAVSVPPGSLVPTAYGSISSDKAGERISAAVGIGFSEDTFGVIMEYSGKCSGHEAEEIVETMVREAFHTRQMRLVKVMVRGVEHTVVQAGCAFAAVALW